ncbi:MAG: hypothetical protein ACOYT4_04925 [Nanoarchaeota archaeon]
MNKREAKNYFLFLLMCGLFLTLNLTFISAGISEDLSNAGASIWENLLRSPLEFIIGETSYANVFFAKLLLMILIFIILYAILGQVPFFNQNSVVMFIISLIVSVLSMRMLEWGWVEAILIPYSTLGIVLTSFFPLIILFYFVERIVPEGALRKIAWIFSGVVFFALFLSRYKQLEQASIGGFNPAYIYLFTAILCLIFLLMDRTIQRAFYKSKMKNIKDYWKDKEIAEIIDQKLKLEEMAARAGANPETDEPYKRQWEALKKRSKRYKEIETTLFGNS